MNFFLNKILNFLIAFVNTILLIFNVSPVDPGADAIDLDDYRLTFSDEFDGDRLDTSKWRAHNAEGIRRGGYWTPDMAEVRDGELVIKTQYLPDGKFGAGWYTAGLSTQGKFEQTYGYYECRCILAKGQGLWSAFWLTNPNVSKVLNGKADKGAEIDVFESPFYYKGGTAKNKVTSNIHFNGYELQTRYSNVGIFSLDNDPYEEYNTYGVLWTADEYIFYINGKEVARSSYGGVSQEPEYMILSCEVDGAEGKPTFGWSGNIENNSKDTFSAEFRVDYVRAYAAK